MATSRIKLEGSYDFGKNSTNGDFNLGTLSVAHAFNRNFFAGASLSYGQSKSENEWESTGYKDSSTSKSSGVADPAFTLGGRVYTGPALFILALTTRIYTGDAEYKNTADGTSENNVKNGGSILTPSVTVHSNSSGLVLGTTLSYSIMAEKTSKDTNTSGAVSITKSTGGNVQNATLFIEGPKSNLAFRGSIDYTKIEVSTYAPNGGDRYQNTAMSFSSATVFFNAKVSSQFNVIPSISYGQLGQGFDNVKTKDLYTASLTGRASF